MTGKPLTPVPRHPEPLMLSALAADAARHIRRVRAVLQVASAGRCKGSLQLLGPFLVGLGEPPHLIGSQLQLAEHCPERLTAIDRVQELLGVATDQATRAIRASFKAHRDEFTEALKAAFSEAGDALSFIGEKVGIDLDPKRQGKIGLAQAALADLDALLVECQ